ncbi:MAG: hypothetical protein ACP5Q0_06685 [Halothiobacillus sp.]
MKNRALWGLLAAPLMLAACQSVGTPAPAQPPSAKAPAVITQAPEGIPGEYLFKLKPNLPDTADTLAQLYRAFQTQSVQSIRPIGNGWYLLILNKNANTDPGLALMQTQAMESGLIETLQPNLPYGIHPPKKPALFGNGSQ